jgi:hypothetical protein
MKKKKLIHAKKREAEKNKGKKKYLSVKVRNMMNREAYKSKVS